jgi:hypothetical protein
LTEFQIREIVVKDEQGKTVVKRATHLVRLFPVPTGARALGQVLAAVSGRVLQGAQMKMKIRTGSKVIIRLHDNRIIEAVVSRVEVNGLRGERVIARSGNLLVNVHPDQIESLVKY